MFTLIIVTGCLTGGGINKCQNNGICLNTNTCQCQVGYIGSFCEIPLGCVSGGSNACLNGGVCIPSTGTCFCTGGYSGSTCSICKCSFFFFK